jgi:hypothetical protein
VAEFARRLDEQVFVGDKRVARQQLPKLAKTPGSTIHRVKVTIHDSKPPIWRRLELPSAMTLDLVHETLQIAFYWEGYHLHAFETACGEFGSPEHNDGWSDRADEATLALAQVAPAGNTKIVYVYDFGDDWQHDIVVEKSSLLRPASLTRGAPLTAARHPRRIPAACGAMPVRRKTTSSTRARSTADLAGLSAVVAQASP